MRTMKKDFIATALLRHRPLSTSYKYRYAAFKLVDHKMRLKNDFLVLIASLAVTIGIIVAIFLS